MLKDFNSGAEFVVSSLKSESHKRTYKCCYKRLREYLEQECKDFSLETGVVWLEFVKSHYPQCCFSVYRTAVYRLNEYLTTGVLNTPSREIPFNGAPKYVLLSQNSRKMLDNAIAVSSYHGSGKNSYRIAVADYLYYVEKVNGISDTEIDFSKLKKYLLGLKANWSYGAYRDRLNYIFSFISFISDGIESELFSSYHGNSSLTFVEELDQETQAKIKEIQAGTAEPSENISDVYNRVMSVIKEKELTVSVCLSSRYRARWNSFFLFLILNGFSFSAKMTEIWIKIIGVKALPLLHMNVRCMEKPKEHHTSTNHQSPSMLRTSYIILPKEKPEDRLLFWSRSLLLEFLDSELRKEKAENTVCAEKYACIRFLSFAEEIGVSSCDEITPQVLDRFNAWDKHKTNEGKKGYNSKISKFIEYLGETGRVSKTLYLGLPCKVAPQVRIVKVLNEVEIQTIYESKSRAALPMALRDAAIVMLGLRMGLRAGDVVSLKFSDIDWKNQTLHIKQDKTGKPLSLPIPTEVGNCIYRYVKDGRPDSAAQTVFVSHRYPFGNLLSSACAKALNNMLGVSYGEKNKYGFHITRKTFASRILRAGNSVDSVVNLLGHDGDHTVMKYLATDYEKMRMCAIPAAKVVISHD